MYDVWRNTVFLRDVMATTEERRQSGRCDHSRSGRVVILVQIISWCAVGALLILRGVTTLTIDGGDGLPATVTPHTNSSSEVEADTGAPEGAERNATSSQRSSKVNPSAAILITVGTTMLVIGPTLLLARLIDSRRHDRHSVKFSKVDPPPSYDEVVDKAPRYSSLFQVTESGELIAISGHNASSPV
ncbi:uncharacterized protein [Periplaneta americana]|uniref:uncharacterized protein n=1 Tax=Periplaneta americana TaxID=6978 RepID=UPI0037E7D6A8